MYLLVHYTAIYARRQSAFEKAMPCLPFAAEKQKAGNIPFGLAPRKIMEKAEMIRLGSSSLPAHNAAFYLYFMLAAMVYYLQAYCRRGRKADTFEQEEYQDE